MSDSISIIIPMYNAEENIERCLSSIQKQSYKNFYVYLIDDGSIDSTKEKCQIFLKDKRFHYLKKENGGPSSARNLGLTMATEKWVCFVDSDDQLDSNHLLNFISNLSNTNFDIFCMGYIMENNCENKEYSLSAQRCNSKEFINLCLKKEAVWGYPWNKIFRREILRDVYFDESIHMAEDLLFSIQAALKSNNIIIDSKKTYIYNNIFEGISSRPENSTSFLKLVTIIDSYEKLLNILPDDYCNEKKFIEYKIVRNACSLYSLSFDFSDCILERNRMKTIIEKNLLNFIFSFSNQYSIKERIKATILFCFPKSYKLKKK
ncbi:glycosyltransferase family 2 protein [Enterococcus faecium]|uniref:glycosyltransferase family 2 protein n=1 Tax=Enterococcus faecium TaxID=1352 RepID=UPI00338FBD5E